MGEAAGAPPAPQALSCPEANKPGLPSPAESSPCLWSVQGNVFVFTFYFILCSVGEHSGQASTTELHPLLGNMLPQASVALGEVAL